MNFNSIMAIFAIVAIVGAVILLSFAAGSIKFAKNAFLFLAFCAFVYGGVVAINGGTAWLSQRSMSFMDLVSAWTRPTVIQQVASPELDPYLKEMVEINGMEGSRKIFWLSWGNSIVAFMFFLSISLLLAKPALKNMGWIKMVFTINTIFALGWVGLTAYFVLIPIGAFDAELKKKVDFLFWAAFFRGSYWPYVTMALGLIVSLIGDISEASENRYIIWIATAITWRFIPSLLVAINPDILAWSECSNLIRLGLSNSTCQEIWLTGGIAGTVVISALGYWGSLIWSLFDD